MFSTATFYHTCLKMFYGKELINYTTINKFWYNLINSKELTNLLFRKLNKIDFDYFKTMEKYRQTKISLYS